MVCHADAMNRTRALATLLVVPMLALAGCQHAKVGARCRTTDWGGDGKIVMRCVGGRWQRSMTYGQAATIMSVLLSKSAPPAATGPIATFNGTGDDVITLPRQHTPAILHITSSGTSNFIVKTADDLAVNVIGAYEGRVFVDDLVAAGQTEITSNGPWTIEVLALSTARNTGGVITGQGDDVVHGHTALVARVTHDGVSNFIVRTYPESGNGFNLPINEIGHYSGTVLLENAIIVIRADGPWSIVPR